MSAEAGEVWIGLRDDGIEVVRVKATCVEVSRSNGIARFTTLGPVAFADLPLDVSADAIITVADDEYGAPFGAAPLEHWQSFESGATAVVSYVKFDRILDVPRHVRPDRVRLRDRLRR